MVPTPTSATITLYLARTLRYPSTHTCFLLCFGIPKLGSVEFFFIGTEWDRLIKQSDKLQGAFFFSGFSVTGDVRSDGSSASTSQSFITYLHPDSRYEAVLAPALTQSSLAAHPLTGTPPQPPPNPNFPTPHPKRLASHHCRAHLTYPASQAPSMLGIH